MYLLHVFKYLHRLEEHYGVGCLVVAILDRSHLYYTAHLSITGHMDKRYHIVDIGSPPAVMKKRKWGEENCAQNTNGRCSGIIKAAAKQQTETALIVCLKFIYLHKTIHLFLEGAFRCFPQNILNKSQRTRWPRLVRNHRPC